MYAASSSVREYVCGNAIYSGTSKLNITDSCPRGFGASRRTGERSVVRIERGDNALVAFERRTSDVLRQLPSAPLTEHARVSAQRDMKVENKNRRDCRRRGFAGNSDLRRRASTEPFLSITPAKGELCEYESALNGDVKCSSFFFFAHG